jgi:hypothetical protein
MKNSVKGALLSGLVFPGLGQVALRHYRRGAVIMLAVLLSLAGIVVMALQDAQAILEKIELEGGLIDIDTISDTASRVSSSSGSFSYNLLLLLIAAIWVAGTIDAYRIGRKRDVGASQHSSGKNR